MEKPSLDLSSLKTSNYLDFSTDLSEVNAAHDSINELRESLWNDEATFNLAVQFKNLGLSFDNTLSVESLLEMLNHIDINLMRVRSNIRKINNGGVGYFNDNVKYANGLTQELFQRREDLSFLVREDSIDVTKIDYKKIHSSHDEIKKLREFIWCEAPQEFKLKLAAEGIHLGGDTPSMEDYFRIVDTLDLKLKDIKANKLAIDRNTDDNSISEEGQDEYVPVYRHGQKKYLPITVEAIGRLTYGTKIFSLSPSETELI